MDCTQGTICFELMKGLPAAFVTLVIGGIAGVITWRQYQVAKAKLSLDLFEKRFPIFQKTWEIASDVGFKGKVVITNLATPFNNYRPQVRFLFGKDMEEYIDTLSSNYVELTALAAETDGVQSQDRIDNIAKTSLLRKWFYEQASYGVKDKFSPFLDFEKWK
jgi:hypothetical protein